MNEFDNDLDSGELDTRDAMPRLYCLRHRVGLEPVAFLPDGRLWYYCQRSRDLIATSCETL